jgi:hypothetical protein
MDNLVDALFENRPSTLTTVGIVDEQVDAECNFAPTVYINSTKQVDNPALIVMNATLGESLKLHKQAVTQSKNLFETLREILERKAYLHLGCLNFKDYFKKLKREVQYLEISERAFFYQLAHREVAATLSDAGVDTRNLTQQQAAKLNQLPPALQAETYKLAQEKSAEEPPQGKAGDFHHVGKVYLEKLDDAIAETTGKVLDDDGPDPFDPNETSPARPDFFSADNRQRMSEQKPELPPVTTEGAQETEEEQEPTRLTYASVTRYTGEEGDFLFIRGDDGYDYYEIPVRVETIRALLK